MAQHKSHSAAWKKRRPSFAKDEDAARQERLRDALETVSKVVYAMGSDKELTVCFPTDQAETAVNDPGKPTVAIDPTIITKAPKDADPEQLDDVLVGTALLGAASKATVNRHVWKAATTKGKRVRSIYKASEIEACNRYTEDRAPGFAPYIEARIDHRHDAEYQTKLEEAAQLDGFDKETAQRILEYQLTDRDRHPLTGIPERYTSLIDAAAEELRDAETSHERLETAARIWSRFEDEEDKNPPPGNPQKGEGDQDQDDQSQGGSGEGDQEGDGEGDPGEAPGSTADERQISGIQDTVDASQIQDAKAANTTAKPDAKGGSNSPTLTAVSTGAEVKAPPTRHQSASIYAARVARLKKQIQDLRERLVWRNDAPDHAIHAQRDGVLDPGSIVNLFTDRDEPRVFETYEAPAKPSIAIGIMVDESGSMYSLMSDTKDVCTILAEALSGIDGVDVFVWGFTSGFNHATGDEYTVIKEIIGNRTGIDADRARIEELAASGSTPTPDGIGAATNELLNAPKEYASRAVFVLTDGGANVGSSLEKTAAAKLTAAQQVRLMCDEAKRYNVDVYGVGINLAYDQATSDRYYGTGRGTVLPDVKTAGRIIGNYLAKAIAK